MNRLREGGKYAGPKDQIHDRESTSELFGSYSFQKDRVVFLLQPGFGPLGFHSIRVRHREQPANERKFRVSECMVFFYIEIFCV